MGPGRILRVTSDLKACSLSLAIIIYQFTLVFWGSTSFCGLPAIPLKLWLVAEWGKGSGNETKLWLCLLLVLLLGGIHYAAYLLCAPPQYDQYSNKVAPNERISLLLGNM